MLNRFRADLGLKIFKVFRLLGQAKTHFGNQQDHDTYRHRLPPYIRINMKYFCHHHLCYYGVDWEEPWS